MMKVFNSMEQNKQRQICKLMKTFVQSNEDISNHLRELSDLLGT